MQMDLADAVRRNVRGPPRRQSVHLVVGHSALVAAAYELVRQTWGKTDPSRFITRMLSLFRRWRAVSSRVGSRAPSRQNRVLNSGRLVPATYTPDPDLPGGGPVGRAGAMSKHWSILSFQQRLSRRGARASRRW